MSTDFKALDDTHKGLIIVLVATAPFYPF